MEEEEVCGGGTCLQQLHPTLRRFPSSVPQILVTSEPWGWRSQQRTAWGAVGFCGRCNSAAQSGSAL